MLKQKKQKYPTVLMLALGLILSTTACETTKIVVKAGTPDVVFPVFPDPTPVTLDEKAAIVMMPLWYWQKIAEYKIDVDSIEEYLLRLQKEDSDKEK